ncbi:MAG: adenosyl-hopene transferase HpnH [Pseudomonadota bacterium]|nr:adenosyl-hopene transferase HpnH [Pseudomonadota bacterium]
MSVPLLQKLRVGTYVLKKRVMGIQKYPLVLMLEPLFRCNLACPGCGKIDYESEILNRRLSIEDCLSAAEECGAPIVSIPGGEPLLHRDIEKIVEGIIKQKRFVYLCTNGLLLEKKLHLFSPSPYLTFSVHLDGLEKQHDEAVGQKGVFIKAVSAIRKAKALGFRVNVNCTLFNQMGASEVVEFLDFVTDDLDVEGVTVSPGYAYERAPEQDHFLNRSKTKSLFRDVFEMGKQSNWKFSQSSLFLDFLAGNQSYTCTPWGNPTRNVFGWQRPCYLLSEGYAQTFQDLLNETNWETYGTGNYEKCADCMVHCGYEPTAVSDALSNPLKAFLVSFFGVDTKKPMKAEIELSNQRPAEDIYDNVIRSALDRESLTNSQETNKTVYTA